MPSAQSRWRARRFGLAGLAVLALGATSVACRVPREYRVSEVIGTQAGLNNPWEIAFLGDGTMFVTERAGDVSVRLTNGTLRPLNVNPQDRDVVASGEGGMMGLAIDPNFGTNRRIYTCYLTAGDVRVVRWTVDQGLTALAGKQAIVTAIPRSSGRHSGCRLAFGPEGALWITTGDAALCNTSQNGQSLGGKVLRVNTDGGAVAGNISRSGFDGRIYAYGFRNPQGISFRGDGAAFLTEHGPDRDDEITRLRSGGNGGWNPGCTYNEGVPMTDTRLPDVMAPFWQSGGSTIAPSGSDVVTDADWGDRSGQLAVAILKGRHLRLFSISDGSTDGGGPVLDTGERLRTAVENPVDGRLYLATDADPGRILAVQPVL